MSKLEPLRLGNENGWSDEDPAHDPSRRQFVETLGKVGFVTLLAGLTTACPDDKKIPQTTVRDASLLLDLDALKECRLIDQYGKPVDLDALKKKPFLADAIFTSCPLTCSTLTTRMAAIDPELAARGIPTVSFSVDVYNDTPAALLKYQNDRHTKHSKGLDGSGKDNWTMMTLAANQYDKDGLPVVDDDYRRRAEIYYKVCSQAWERFTQLGEKVAPITRDALPGIDKGDHVRNPAHPNAYMLFKPQDGKAQLKQVYELMTTQEMPIADYQEKLAKQVIADAANERASAVERYTKDQRAGASRG